MSWSICAHLRCTKCGSVGWVDPRPNWGEVVWDNAAMESFFSSLKTERTARKIYRTRNEARADVFDYIERFYNRASEHPSVYVVEEKRLC